jgi:membrane protease subunit HflK
MRYLATALLLGIGCYFLTGISQIRPGERAVVRRFGRVLATPGPGLWIGLPWGLERVDRVPVDQLRRVVVGYDLVDEDNASSPVGQLLTGDHNLVNLQVTVHYCVAPDQVIAFLEQGEHVDGLVASTAEAILVEWVAARAIDDVLLNGKAALPRHLIGAAQERMDNYHLGVRIADADVTHLLPPEEVKNAFDEVTRAQTSIVTRKNEAKQEAARLLREAETERFRLERQAESYVNEKMGLAQAEARRFDLRRQQYHDLRRRNPDFLKAIWWEEVGKLMQRLRESGGLDLLDNRLGPDGLDITLVPPMPKKK